jgi:hypothetical protein
MQARQVGEAIKRENNGEPVDEFVRDLDIAITNVHRLATREITSLYEVMHDPFRCHLRMHLAILLMFRLAVPLIFNGYMWDPIGTKIFNCLIKQGTVEADLARWKRLIDAAASIPSNSAIANYIKVQSPFSLNYGFFEHLRDEEIPHSVSSMFFYLSGLRVVLLRKLGWRGIVAFDQHLAVLVDLGRALGIRSLFHRKKLRESKFLKWLTSGSPDNRQIGASAVDSERGADLSAPVGLGR